MLRFTHSLSLAVRDENGQPVHQEPVRDLRPCYEDLLFSAVCAGKVPNDGAFPPAIVEPVWRDRRVAGLTLALTGFQKFYGLPIFADRVLEVLVAKKLVEEAGQRERYCWQIEASEAAGDGRRGKLAVSLARRPYPFCDAVAGPGGSSDGPFPVSVSAALLGELREATASSLELERADILTGRLFRAPGGQVSLRVSGRIPAPESSASRAHVTFSPLTFQAVQQELARQTGEETVCGWHHSHPPPCGRDCLLVAPACQTANLFFSLADRTVHRASFPAPYMIGLVSGKQAGKRADDPGFQAYGWQEGVIQEVSFATF